MVAQSVEFESLRQVIPAVSEYAYFQTSGHSLKPQPVLDEVIRWLQWQNQGPALPWVVDEMLARLELARERVARAIHANPDEIMLNENATIGINVVANGIDWHPGDNVVLTTHEHPGNRLPWYNMAQRFGAELRFVALPADDAVFVADVERQIDPHTRLLSLSHVSRQTGRRLPIAAIVAMAHDRNVPVLVDGAQAFGAIPIDVRALDCDFYTLSGHKYIMAPQGTGAFYVRRDRIAWLRPSWIGSRSQTAMDLGGTMTLHESAKRFEFGTRNWADQAGLAKALAMWETIGWEHIFSRLAWYTGQVKQSLSEIPGLMLETPLPYERSSGIVTFGLSGFDASRVVESLLQHERILVSPVEAVEFGVPGVRVSTHVFNTMAELDRLVAGIRRIQTSGL